MSPQTQLTLPVSRQVAMSFANYVGSSGAKFAQTLNLALQRMTRTSGASTTQPVFVADRAGVGQGECIFLAGPADTGKTHLLQAALKLIDEGQVGLRQTYIPCRELPCSRELLDSLATSDVLLLDDLNAWLQVPETEASLFALFNRFKDDNKLLVISAVNVPDQLNIQLPDLLSRLKSALLIVLSPLQDEDKVKILKSIASDKGFDLANEVAGYILRRSQRQIGALSVLLDRLDQASLAEQRRLTIPFVKKVMGW